MFLIMWEFIVNADNSAEFEAIYGSSGEWAKLFAKSQGYVQTQLLRDAANPQRYLTLDLWISRQTQENFRREHAAEYQALDARCERLTVKEVRVGDFESS